jgi:hypothetical protein
MSLYTLGTHGATLEAAEHEIDTLGNEELYDMLDASTQDEIFADYVTSFDDGDMGEMDQTIRNWHANPNTRNTESLERLAEQRASAWADHLRLVDIRNTHRDELVENLLAAQGDE